MKRILLLAITAASLGHAALDRIETLKTEPSANGYEIITAKAHFTFDPKLPANQIIVDLANAPRNGKGLVEATADLVLIQPRDPAQSNGTTLFEVSNRGGSGALNIFGNEFLTKNGYTIAWLGWQFGLPNNARFRIDVPVANGQKGVERWYTLGQSAPRLPINKPGYCAATPTKARLYTRTALNTPRQLVPANRWTLPDPCTLAIEGGFQPTTLYEFVYEAQDPPVAGIGLAAVRDLISWMKTKNAARAKQAIGYGYSQSARMLRQMLYDGFNADEQGKIVFDGLLLAASGAGRGSFNHRFAEPGIAGNSVEAFDEPVDVFPFTDVDQTDPELRRTDGLLHKATQQHVVPKMFHMFSATEYWARVASLIHTSVDGAKDIALPANSRYYFFPGTPHSPAAWPPQRQSFENRPNPYAMAIAFPALLSAMQAWLTSATEPPPSRYPTLANNTLVPTSKLNRASGIEWPTFVPPTTRLDFGKDFLRTGIITKQPPGRGAAYTLLVPQVDNDGNEIGGIRLPHVAVPLGVYGGWNRRTPSQADFGKLAGLTGSYMPRRLLLQRYASKDAYLQQIRAAAEALVKDRFLLPDAVNDCVTRASREWEWLANTN